MPSKVNIAFCNCVCYVYWHTQCYVHRFPLLNSPILVFLKPVYRFHKYIYLLVLVDAGAERIRLEI